MIKCACKQIYRGNMLVTELYGINLICENLLAALYGVALTCQYLIIFNLEFRKNQRYRQISFCKYSKININDVQISKVSSIFFIENLYRICYSCIKKAMFMKTIRITAAAVSEITLTGCSENSTA